MSLPLASGAGRNVNLATRDIMHAEFVRMEAKEYETAILLAANFTCDEVEGGGENQL